MRQYKLDELVSNGSNARKEVNPTVIVSDGEYPKGTILDANVSDKRYLSKDGFISAYLRYTIDFIKGNVVQEYNVGNSIIVKSIEKANVSDITLYINSNPTDINSKQIIIPANALLTWEIVKTNEQIPSALGIIYEYYEN